MAQRINLTVFLGYDATLTKLDEVGVLDRELAIFRRLQERDVNVSFVTYGSGREELRFSSRMSGMRILCNQFGLPQKTYIRRIHQLHMIPLLCSDVLRTWQSTGIISALRANWAWQVPLIVRMSYNWSKNASIEKPNDLTYIAEVSGLERQALTRARHVITTTPEIAENMIEKVPVAASKLSVIPNFVDENLFRSSTSKKIYDLVYVGRMQPVKNLEALLEAVERLGLSIAMIGSASTPTQLQYLRKLKDRFGELNGRIHWLGRVSNEDLPAVINQARIHVLCSLTEGHPRALIEAMACGMPIVGTNVHGIGSTLKHESTGYLCDTDSASLAHAIDTVLSNPTLMRKMGENARRFALEHYSLEQLAEREIELLLEVVRQNPVRSAKQRFAQYLFRRNNLGLQT